MSRENRRMVCDRNLLFLTLIVAALLGQYGRRSDHQIAIVGCDGSFKFYADEQSDGSYTYEASLVPEHFWLFAPQAESGCLSSKDWEAFQSIHRYDKLPKFDESELRDPGDHWGVMQRGEETMELREAEWNDLASTQVNESLWSMAFKAKNGR